ncbi:MAG: hypothetical protein ACK5WZ_15380 [Pseudobdellovibrionaceae bacterium]
MNIPLVSAQQGKQISKKSKVSSSGQKMTLKKKTAVDVGTPSKIETKVASEAPTEKKQFGLKLSAKIYTAAKDNEEGFKDQWIDYALTPSWQFTDRLTLSGSVLVSQSLNGEKKTDVLEAVMPLSYKGWFFSEKIYTRHMLVGVFPAYQKSRDLDKYQGGLRIGNGLIAMLDPLSLSYSFSVQRNFHRIDQIESADPIARENTLLQWQLRHRFDASLNFTENFQTGLAFVYIEGFSYGEDRPHLFSSDLSFDYQFTDVFSAAIGVTNDASAFKENNSSNTRLFDDKTSAFYLGGGLKF